MTRMPTEQWKRIEELFHEAKMIATADRASWLQEQCGDDSELLLAVESLLRAENQAQGFLNTPAVDDVGSQILKQSDESSGETTDPLIGKHVDRYRVVQVIGQGGMGKVYLAEQDKPRRMVALKIMKPGFTSAHFLKRFEFETEVLGRLQHPGIAQIFDAGTADLGMDEQPYFAMEFIEGKPLLDYVIENSLSTKQRLKLFVDICLVVHHAHQHGVIHRDLKPTNILVDHDCRPKILDFGIARSTDSDIQTTTLQTDIGQLIGTIPYMSPEQVSGDSTKLDVRSDVYALGVVAYELLTGNRPYELKEKSIADAVRTIEETTPRTLSSNNKIFRGDLDTIIGKALEKEPERRYQSAAELALDIERYLDDQPIIARPPSTVYQLRKFAKRNRALVGGVAAVIIALAVGTIVSIILAVRATSAELRERNQRIEAERQTAIAQAVNDFLNHDLLGAGSPEEQGKDVTIRHVLDVAAEKIESRFPDQPLVEAAIRETLGNTYSDLAEFEMAERHILRALELRQKHLGPAHAQTQASINLLGSYYHKIGRLDDAEKYYRESMEALRTTKGNGDPQTLNSINGLGLLLHEMRRFEEAEPLLRDALEGRRRVLGEDHIETVTSLNNMAILLQATNRFDDAEPFLRDVRAGLKRIKGVEHPYTLYSTDNLGCLLRDIGRPEEAIPLHQEALDGFLKVLGKDHPSTFVGTLNLGIALHANGQLDEADSKIRAALLGFQNVLGEKHPSTLMAMYSLSKLLMDQEQFEEAESFATQCLAGREALFGSDHPLTQDSIKLLESLYIE